MQELDIKRGHFGKIEGDQLKHLMGDIFGGVEESEGGKLTSTFGAMAPISVWVKDKKALCIDIITQIEVDDKTAMDSIRAKNKFLEAATGFSAKERLKRAKNKAKKGP